jgi:ABC-type Fe3+-hydroxamate transport system substrate-binding protein
MGVIDQLQRTVEVSGNPIRIVSLVPSITELLFDLGLDSQIAGVTKFCIHPGNLTSQKVKVGGTKNINHEKIKSIAPDLIIANKEENTPEDIYELANHYPVWVSDVNDLHSAVNMIRSVGQICNRKVQSDQLADAILQAFGSIKKQSGLTALYVIWDNPVMAAGGDTFINDMLERCGVINMLKHKERYPVLDEEEIKTAKPDIIMLSSEPYPFRDKHVDLWQKKYQCKVVNVDGTYFSWYGSRMKYAPAYFNALIETISSTSDYQPLTK